MIDVGELEQDLNECMNGNAAGLAIHCHIRKMIDEKLAAHVAECHAPQPGPNAWAARPWEVSEKPGTSNSGPIIACDVKQEQPEAGDWAMEAWLEAKRIFTSTINYVDDACANAISVFGNRQFAPHFADLHRQLSEATKERDALRESSTVEHAKRLADRLDAAEKERDAALDCVKVLEVELDQAATRLQKTHPIGEYKGIGLREVGLATEQVCDELDAARAECERLRPSNRPKVVCLCGSTRFMGAFQKANLDETIAGNIVLSIGCNTKSDADLMALGELTTEAKAKLDELHFRKIDMADEVFVLNVGGYIGESTRREIGYANSLKKPVRYLVNGDTSTPPPTSSPPTARPRPRASRRKGR